MLGQATDDSRLTKLTMGRTRGKSPPFPIQYSLHLSAAPTSEWLFVPGFLKKNPKTVSIWTPATLQGYNSLLRPLIGTRSKVNLQFLLRAFQRCVAFHLHALGLGRSPTFNGRESNCQFDSRSLTLNLCFCHNLCCRCPNGSSSSSSTSTFQQFPNDIKNASM